MSESLLRNIVKLHLSELPATFSLKLQSFFSRQPVFNEEVSKVLDESERRMRVLAEKQASLERDLKQLKAEVDRQQKTGG